MFLSIIIPTYNEAENISKLLEQICQHVSEIECEILIVDDNSPDNTAGHVEKFKDDYSTKNQNSSISICVIKRKKKMVSFELVLMVLKIQRAKISL